MYNFEEIEKFIKANQPMMEYRNPYGTLRIYQDNHFMILAGIDGDTKKTRFFAKGYISHSVEKAGLALSKGIFFVYHCNSGPAHFTKTTTKYAYDGILLETEADLLSYKRKERLKNKLNSLD